MNDIKKLKVNHNGIDKLTEHDVRGMLKSHSKYELAKS